MPDLKLGDLVTYTRRFLQSTGWYTDVPVNGKVTKIRPLKGVTLVWVEWPDGYSDGWINAANLIPMNRIHLEAP